MFIFIFFHSLFVQEGLQVLATQALPDNEDTEQVIKTVDDFKLFDKRFKYDYAAAAAANSLGKAPSHKKK